MTHPRPSLPAGAAAHLADFEDPAILGASRQIATANNLFIALVQEHTGSPAEVLQDLRAVTAYLIEQRGASTQAIPNALAQMLAGSTAWKELDREEFQQQALRSLSGYGARSQRDRDRVTDTGVTVAANAQRILAYDYSSSVAAILSQLGASTAPPTVVIPEARSLNGGRRFVEDLAATNLTIEFVPDAALSSLLQICDLALIGAETVGADGSCYNTVGSLGVALACDFWRVALYVPTTLIKLDTRTLWGYQRPLPPLHDSRLGGLVDGWSASHQDRVHVLSPDLDRVPASLITGYITEVGVLPPTAMSMHAARLAEDLNDV